MDFNNESLKFSLQDETEYEEEVIERDEFIDAEEGYGYYDDDDEEEIEEINEENEYYDDYPDDEYDEEYDDEGYDDEEYYDDEYDNEGYDEDYNENLPTQYAEGDALDKILEEIAKLRAETQSREVAPPVPAAPAPVAPAQPMYHPQPVYYPQPMPASQPPGPIIFHAPPAHNYTNNYTNELMVYNELAKIREELVKTQANQAMFAELSRVKDIMALDAKITETRLQDEIKRLTEKIYEISFKR